MNLCFSIVTLLLAKAYIALTIAGLKEPLSGWRYACTGAWLLVLTYLIAFAVGATNLRRAAFGRASVGCIFAYGLLTWLPIPLSEGMARPNVLASIETPSRATALPHHWLATWIVERSPYYAPQSSRRVLSTGQPAYVPTYAPWLLPQSKVVEWITALNCALLLGLVGGCMTASFQRSVRNDDDPNS